MAHDENAKLALYERAFLVVSKFEFVHQTDFKEETVGNNLRYFDPEEYSNTVIHLFNVSNTIFFKIHLGTDRLLIHHGKAKATHYPCGSIVDTVTRTWRGHLVSGGGSLLQGLRVFWAVTVATCA